jgi:drug/metabolite transporter (DMT)-like permease
MSYPIAGAAMEKIPVYLFTAVTLLIAAVVSIPFAKMKEPEIKWTKLGGQNYFKIFMQSLIGAVLYTVFLLYGLTYSSPIMAGIMTSIAPAATLILAFFILKEKITARKVVAVILAVVAVLIMQVQFGAGPSTFNLFGFVFLCLSVLSVSLFFILAKQISYDLPPFTMTAGILIPGAIMMLPLGLYDMMHFDMSTLTSTDWWVMIYYGVLVWYVPYLLTYLAYQYVSATFVGMGMAITPVAAVVTSVLFFGAQMRTVDYIALILVIISVLVIEGSDQNAETEIIEGSPQ